MRLVSLLKLSYTPDDCQVHLIRRILQGYDSIFCAGTGYGKSLIFEGLAVLAGTKKLVIVISPLKASSTPSGLQSVFFTVKGRSHGIISCTLAVISLRPFQLLLSGVYRISISAIMHVNARGYQFVE